MQEIIACLLQNRLTTVLGVPGIGKTTIVKSTGFHLAERKTFHDGIMFFTMRGKDQTTALIQMLFLFLKKYDPSCDAQSKGAT
jgi:MoxR-like ATPase